MAIVRSVFYGKKSGYLDAKVKISREKYRIGPKSTDLDIMRKT